MKNTVVQIQGLSEKDFKKVILEYCYQNNILYEEIEWMEKLVTSECGIELFEKKPFSIEKQYEILKEMNHNLKKITSMHEHTSAYEVLGRSYTESEKKYIDLFLEKAKVYSMLYQMYKDRYDILREIYEKKVCYKKYGKYVTAFGWYYCPSAIMDLVVGGADRGKLYKRNPKDLSEKIEYDYDKNGQLIMCKAYKKGGEMRSIDFFIHFSEYIMRVSYNVNMKNPLEDIFLQKYENERIIWFEHVSYWEKSMFRESYNYSEGLLKESWNQECHFPIEYRKYTLLGECNQYFFEYNKNGEICSYKVQEWLGDEKKVTVWDNHIFEISAKKRKDTGKDANRWKRPNYFRE